MFKLIFCLLISSVAFAGLPPTSLSGGNSSSTAKTTFFTQVPFNQATQVSGVTGRIETGSENILPNPNFEAKVLNWITFLGTGTVQNTTSSPIAEKQSMEIIDGGTGGYTVATSGSVAIPGGFSGINGQFFCRFKNKLTSSVTIFMSAQDNGANVLGSATFTLPGAVSAPVNQLQGFNFIYNSTMTAITPLVQIVTGAGDVLVDDCYVGPATNIGIAVPNSSWTSYTPTFTGFGTVSSSNCQWQQMGTNLNVRCTFTAGTPTATEARVSYPSPSMLSYSTNPTLSIVGSGARNAANAEAQTVLTEPSVNYFTFGIASATPTSALVKQNGSTIVAAGNVYSFVASVPITGWSSSGTAWSMTCPYDGSCVNEFSAEVSATGVVTSTNVPSWVTCSGSTSPYTCTWQTSLFSVAPSCTATPHLLNLFSAGTVSTTGQQFAFTNTTGTGQSNAFALHCSRQGSDIKPVYNAPIFVGSVITQIPNAGEKRWKFNFSGGANYSWGTVCSSGNCATSSVLPTGTTLSYNGSTGNYLFTVPSGTCNTVLSCGGSGFDGTHSNYVTPGTTSAPSATTFQFAIGNGASSFNSYGILDCSCY